MAKAPFICLILLIILMFSALNCSSLRKQWISSYFSFVTDNKAKSAVFKRPPAPYKRQPHRVLDAVWLNPDSGASISYFSSCSQIQKDLSAFQASSYPSNLGYKLIQRSRAAGSLSSVLEMSPNKPKGKRAYIAIHTFKKKNCYFNLNLISPSKRAFKREQPVFQSFVESFDLK